MCIQKEVEKFLNLYCKKIQNKKILVACSGGPDSIALVHLLLMLAKSKEFEIAVAHVDHGIRNVSKDEALWVEDFCKQYNIKFFLKTIDVPKIIREVKGSLELVARELRYEFMAQLMKDGGFDYLATGHHLNDQGETILMHLLRGAGPDGLQGIKPYAKRKINGVDVKIIRPLLNLTKEDLLAYCKKADLDFCQDLTNFSVEYTRNKIRLELIPQLEQYNPQLLSSLANIGKIMYLQQDFLKQTLEEILPEVIEDSNEDGLKLKIKELKELHPYLRHNVYRYCYEKIHGSTKDLSALHIAILEEFLYNGYVNKKLDLPYGIEVKRNYTDILWYKAMSVNSQKLLDIDDIGIDTRDLENNEEKVVEFGEYRLIFGVTNDLLSRDDEILIPLDDIAGQVVIRSRKNGDRIALDNLGLKKVKELFINAKIPADMRDEIPVIVDDKGIICIAKFRVSKRCRITKGQHLYIKINKLGG